MTLTPSIPAAYVGGTVTLTPGVVSNLLDLIQQQLQPNCPGSCTELQIWADASNAGGITVGSASSIGGPLTATNYAYKLTTNSGPRIYRSTYPGNSVPIGDLQVMAAQAAILHIEVQS